MIPTHIDISACSQVEMPSSGILSEVNIVMCQVTSMQSMILFMNLKQRSLASVERQLLNLWSLRLYHKCIMIRSLKPGLRRVTQAPLISSGNVHQHSWGGQCCMCSLNLVGDKTCWRPEIKPAAFGGHVGHATGLKWDMSCLVHLYLSLG